MIKKRLGVVISTVGRPTLDNTISSIFKTEHFQNGRVSIYIFANQIDDVSQLMRLQHLARVNENVILRVSDSRLSMWESRRAGLNMAIEDFIWPLGDDDQVFPGALNSIFHLMDKSQNECEIFTLNGIWSDYEGHTGSLVRQGAGTFESKSPSQILEKLNATMNSLDLGRFIVSKSIKDTWANQHLTIDETWHEEYRALYEALLSLITQNQAIRVSEIIDKCVVLGNVKKSWSSSYLPARMGQIRMLQNLPKEFSPGSNRLSIREMKFFFSGRHLLSIRLRHPDEKLDVFQLKPNMFQKFLVRFVNFIPTRLIELIRKALSENLRSRF